MLATERVGIRRRHCQGAVVGAGVFRRFGGIHNHEVAVFAVHIVGACDGGSVYQCWRVVPRVGGELITPDGCGPGYGAEGLGCDGRGRGREIPAVEASSCGRGIDDGEDAQAADG